MPSAVSSGMMTAAIIVTYEVGSAFWPGVQTSYDDETKANIAALRGLRSVAPNHWWHAGGHGRRPCSRGCDFWLPIHARSCASNHFSDMDCCRLPAGKRPCQSSRAVAAVSLCVSSLRSLRTTRFTRLLHEL